MTPLSVPPDSATYDAVVSLRATRRRRRLGDAEWGELAYRVYTTALFCLVVAMMLSGWIGDRSVASGSVARVADRGPAWAGLLLAAVVVLGVRSGARGGPLALEAADVHHLLLSPPDRTATLRRPSIDVLGYGCLTGAVVFAVVGSLLSQRLPGSNAAWVAAGALFGAMLAACTLGSAMLTASRRLPRLLPVLVVWLLLVWATVEVVLDATGRGRSGVPPAPTTLAGELLFWPLRSAAGGVAWVAAGLALTLLGAAAIGGLSIEAARRRTQLVGQLRFAVTLQDLRSVVLLRRQLASEHPRNRSWFPVARAFARRFPVVGRDLQSVAHWPAIRIARVLVLCGAAGLAMRGVWSGTTPLVLVAGLATFVAALDAMEPLAQEIDHPTLTASFPLTDGELHVRHLVQPCLVMLVGGGFGLLAAWAVDPGPQVLSVGAAVALTAALAAVAGAAISVLSATAPETSDALMTPEVAGPRLVVRTAWPPLVSVIGFLPALVAARAGRGTDPLEPALTFTPIVLALVAIAFGWVRFRADIHRSLAESVKGSGRS